MKEQFPVEKHNRIIYAQLKNDAIDFSATDWMASPTLEPKPGNTFSIYMTGNSFDELKTVFDKLSVGADKDKRTFIKLNDAPMKSMANSLINTRFPGFSEVIRRNELLTSSLIKFKFSIEKNRLSWYKPLRFFIADNKTL